MCANDYAAQTGGSFIERFRRERAAFLRRGPRDAIDPSEFRYRLYCHSWRFSHNNSQWFLAGFLALVASYFALPGAFHAYRILLAILLLFPCLCTAWYEVFFTERTPDQIWVTSSLTIFIGALVLDFTLFKDTTLQNIVVGVGAGSLCIGLYQLISGARKANSASPQAVQTRKRARRVRREPDDGSGKDRPDDGGASVCATLRRPPKSPSGSAARRWPKPHAH